MVTVDEHREVFAGFACLIAAVLKHVDDVVVHADDVWGVLGQVVEEIGFDDVLYVLLAITDSLLELVYVQVKDYSYPCGDEI